MLCKHGNYMGECVLCIKEMQRPPENIEYKMDGGVMDAKTDKCCDGSGRPVDETCCGLPADKAQNKGLCLKSAEALGVVHPADKSQLPEEPEIFHNLIGGESNAWVKKSDYDALRAAYEAQKKEIYTIEKCIDGYIGMSTAKESAERRVAELEAALKKYGGHGYSDVMCEHSKHSDYPCTCGFDEALKGTK